MIGAEDGVEGLDRERLRVSWALGEEGGLVVGGGALGVLCLGEGRRRGEGFGVGGLVAVVLFGERRGSGLGVVLAAVCMGGGERREVGFGVEGRGVVRGEEVVDVVVVVVVVLVVVVALNLLPTDGAC